jgi:diguanylate cyclase (GGDEF)-like protein
MPSMQGSVLEVPRLRAFRREWLIAAFTGLLAVGAVFAVSSLHRQADSRRQAQVQLADVETAAEQIATVPFISLYESTRQGRQALARATRRIGADLETLRGLAPSPQLDRIAASSHVFSQDVQGIMTLIATLKAAGVKQIGALPDPTGFAGFSQIQKRAEREYNAIIAPIRSASGGYRDAAWQANVEAYAGSALAILIAYLGFVAVLRGLARARRESEAACARAEALAADNARLLAASRVEANTDPLTGLPNRRKLMADLAAATKGLEARRRLQLVLFDLDGFKQYNDSFGHPAGDALLVRLGTQLGQAAASRGAAYRMGGDEFCAVCRLDGVEDPQEIVDLGRAALTEHGDGFHVSASYGAVLLPAEADEADAALRLADQRLYVHKSFSPIRGTSLARSMLLQALTERSSALGAHLARVADLSELLADHLRLPAAEVAEIRLAAELHDIGKVAMPEAILGKPDKLSDEEWLLIKQHTVTGESIVAAAGSSLHEVGRVVRASHERVDGAGYPDGLAGESIPLGARIIAVCDAYDAMLTTRPYSSALTQADALAELETCAGSQFDPRLVAAFMELIRSGALERRAAA